MYLAKEFRDGAFDNFHQLVPLVSHTDDVIHTDTKLASVRVSSVCDPSSRNLEISIPSNQSRAVKENNMTMD